MGDSSQGRLFGAALLLLGVVACGGPGNTMYIPSEPGCRISHSPTESGIAWIPAPDTADRPRLDRWCAGVGPAVISSPIAPAGFLGSNSPFEPPQPVDSVAAISWNTHVGGGDIVRLVSELEAGKLSGGVPVRHFVLMLQEVFREGVDVPVSQDAAFPPAIRLAPHGVDREDIVATAARLGLHLFYAPSMANGRPAAGDEAEDRGNAILSTLPLTDLAAIELPFEAQRRVAVAATVVAMTSAGRRWDLRFASVHLDHRSRTDRLYRSFGAGRTRQARALVAALTGDRIVLGGDLNTWSITPLEGAARVLKAHFPLPELPPTQATFGTSAGLGGMKLDRLMYRVPPEWAGPVKRIDRTFGSDHHPLLGWIRPGVDH